jgi:excisionase family DNA binding protein
MPIVMKDQTYYRTAEVCKMVGVSRSTLLRWISSGLIRDTATRDRRGWRLFTEADIKRIEGEAHKVNQKT